jgi:hypothetical protein
VIPQYVEPRGFEARIIIVIEVIESDDLVAPGKQPLRHEEPNKSGRTGNQDLHVGLQPPVGLIGGKQIFHVV